MYYLNDAKKQAEAKMSATTCPKNKSRCEEVCSKCEDKQWCQAALPTLEHIAVPDDVRKWL